MILLPIRWNLILFVNNGIEEKLAAENIINLIQNTRVFWRFCPSLSTYTYIGERPYICDKCSLAFTQTGNFGRQKKINSDEKLFQSSQCSYKCRRKDHLKKHVDTNSSMYHFQGFNFCYAPTLKWLSCSNCEVSITAFSMCDVHVCSCTQVPQREQLAIRYPAAMYYLRKDELMKRCWFWGMESGETACCCIKS